VPIHVLIRRLRGQGDGRAITFNRSNEWVEERIVGPWDRGEDIVVNGEHWNPRDIQITLRETDEDVTNGDSLATWNSLSRIATDRTDELLARPAGNTAPDDTLKFAEDRRKVMVVLGRNPALGAALFTFLRTIDLLPLEWTQLVGTANTGAPYIGQVLDAAFSQSQAVVVLSTPDDIAYLRGDLVPDGDPENEATPEGQARPNVFYEAGMAMGRFPTRTIFVEVGTMRSASDLGGIHAVRMNEGPECRRDLAKRLEDAGCEVNTDGTDWLSAGAFPEPPPPDAPVREIDDETSALVQRINAFLGDLPGNGYATMTLARTFNELVDESGIDGIPHAQQMARMSSMASMSRGDMRMLLNQIKARL
jgi:predicted nucleotide-binding protein